MLTITRRHKVPDEAARQDLAEIEAEIERVRTEALAALAEKDRLEGLAATELDDEPAERFLREARAASRAARRAEQRLDELRGALDPAKHEARRLAFSRHRAILADAGRRVTEAAVALAEANAAAIRAREAALAEVGGVADNLLPRLLFATICIPAHVAAWQGLHERDIAALERAELPRPAPAPPIPSVEERKRRAALPVPAIAPRPVIVLGGVPVAVAPPVKTPAPAAAPAPAITVQARPAPRPLRQDPPPSEGWQQILLIRSNIELPDGLGMARAGDRVNLPADSARRLVENGAADFISKVREMRDAPPAA